MAFGPARTRRPLRAAAALAIEFPRFQILSHEREGERERERAGASARRPLGFIATASSEPPSASKHASERPEDKSLARYSVSLSLSLSISFYLSIYLSVYLSIYLWVDGRLIRR